MILSAMPSQRSVSPRTNVPKQDETEARVVHRTLCELVERQDPALLGGDLSQVGRDT